MALRAGGAAVRPGEGEAGLAVVKGRPLPAARGVALGAALPELPAVGVILAVAGDACLGRAGVGAACVALRAGGVAVWPGEGEAGPAGVKGRFLPAVRGVALGAALPELLAMGVVLAVAGDACLGGAGEHAGRMAFRAGQRGMLACIQVQARMIGDGHAGAAAAVTQHALLAAERGMAGWRRPIRPAWVVTHGAIVVQPVGNRPAHGGSIGPRAGPGHRCVAQIARPGQMALRGLVAGGAGLGREILRIVAGSAISSRVPALQGRTVHKVIGTCPGKSMGRVASLALVAKMRHFRRLVAVGTLVLDLAGSLVAAITLGIGVPALQGYGVGHGRIQVYGWPGPAVAGRIGAKARIIVAKLDLAVAVRAFVVGQEAVVPDKVGLQVG